MALEDSRGLDTSDAGANKVPALQGKKYLLAFGISRYQDGCGVDSLTYPDKDVQRVADLLTREYGFETPILKKNEECTANAIIQCIVDLIASLKPEDDLVVFFSGHGAIKKDVGYWITHDAQKTLENNLEIDKVLKQLLGVCKQVLLIVDCCFSGATTEEAYSSAVFNKAKLESKKFSVITAGNKYQKVPDKSIFLEALLNKLSGETIFFLEGLVDELKKSVKKAAGPDVTYFTNDDQSGMPFIFQRKNQFSFELTNAFFELNYNLQSLNIKGLGLFNLIYLRGTKECGHHLFTQRYFRENKVEDVNLFNFIPQVISFGRECQDEDYNIWRKLSVLLNYSTAEPKDILSQILPDLRSKSWVLIAKVDKNCENETLATALAEFWKTMNEQLSTLVNDPSAYSNMLYFFIWDRRGDSEEAIKKTNWERPKKQGLARALHLPPVEELDPDDDLSPWQAYIKKQYSLLQKEQDFTTINFSELKPDLTVQNVILQITDLCKKADVYENLFIKNALWTQ